MNSTPMQQLGQKSLHLSDQERKSLARHQCLRIGSMLGWRGKGTGIKARLVFVLAFADLTDVYLARKCS